jgi:hypothetical protein
VWKFTGVDEPSETDVTAVTSLPVDSLAGALIGAEVTLACGQMQFAMIGNVDTQNARKSEAFVMLTFFRPDGKRFHLARYFDVDLADYGPDQLAEFLGRPKAEIFPIAWDVSAFARGNPQALSGQILEEPLERLSRYELIRLSVG